MQGVVTAICPVHPSATAIKVKSRDQAYKIGAIKGSRWLFGLKSKLISKAYEISVKTRPRPYLGWLHPIQLGSGNLRSRNTETRLVSRFQVRFLDFSKDFKGNVGVSDPSDSGCVYVIRIETLLCLSSLYLNLRPSVTTYRTTG